MHVGAKRLFGQPASACFCPCEEKRFCEKQIKNDAIFEPQKRGPFLNLPPLAPVKFCLKMVRATKNGAQKNEKMLAEASRNYCGKAIALTCNRNLGLYI